ncbi:UDP-GlcNAc:betaGal beta-1,3-N-acetylglucosaminyltransferase-like protein 1 isoform X2 [Callorhinchus milii]|uniref:UDP-GlcNAc:betaGal beta-1,3-N-acetylglucosaminyltransferase-like protein 1 isoform X2 n=1 Tax=Callorhinchus milii TaxID=7868 RepID=UPI001C3F9004|nr:UDP-GlcNAc:betaGal beta-1,3-N-acetylglucosaminyltransferase-like protein 1 isoform X2 [Callorhinchus milii]
MSVLQPTDRPCANKVRDRDVSAPRGASPPPDRREQPRPRFACRREHCRSDVTIILPIHNAAKWLDECLESVLEQDFEGSLQLSVFNDASQDDSMNIVEKWMKKFQERNIPVVIDGHKSPQPKGVGFAKNRAVAQSSGRYLCFLDADDVMMPQRVKLQYEAAMKHPNCIIGCQVRRDPGDSTERYTRWINSLTQEQLFTQVYTSHGPTVIMPTWFCSRDWFDNVGKLDEGGKGVPEDLLFFYENLRKGGSLLRLNCCLLVYRYHAEAATLSVLEETIWNERLRFLEERVLNNWTSFTIWNAGKQGRKLYRYLSATNQQKVVCFCDVDEAKIKKRFYTYQQSKEKPKPTIPIKHFTDASPPFIICVKLDMTGGGFEENLNSLNLKEGIDYHHFS